MNVDDLKPFPVGRFGGQVDYQDPTKVINGCALLAQNVRFLPDQVGTCFGTVDTMTRPQSYEEVTGINVFDVLGVVNPGEIPVVFGDEGSLLQESPAGSGALVPLSPPFPLPEGAYMRATDAENTTTMAFSDGTKGLVPPLRLNGVTGLLSTPQNPIGGLWSRDLIYQLGDLVRSADRRWWRCSQSATMPGSNAGPQWPQFNGYFSGGTTSGGFSHPGVWNPATVADAVGGSVWEEWTPACAQYLPAPDVSNVGTVNAPGTGSIPTGKDVYIKLAYSTVAGCGPRSAPLIFLNTGVNDAITFGQNGAGGVVATNGGVNMPRWIAEILLNPVLFWQAGTTFPIALVVHVAAVAHGAAAPADSAYTWFNRANLKPCEAITVDSIPVSGVVPQNGAPVPYVGPNAPGSVVADIDLGGYIGEFGQRYMIVTRYNKNGSLAPVDPGSAISVNLVGRLQLPIVTILRDASGNVECTVGDVTAGWTIGANVIVGGCTGDTTLNGTFPLTNVQPTLNPQGILSWQDPSHLSATNDKTGTVTLPAGPPAVAFLPPGGPNDLEDVAAFTAVGSSAAGPFFYISEAPERPYSSPIVSMEGAKVIFSAIGLTRDAGGFVSATIADLGGIAVGDLITVFAATDVTFNGEFGIAGVVPGTGTAGTLTWQQADFTASSGTAACNIQIGEASSVQITVKGASGFALGDTCLADTGALETTGKATAFDGVVVIAAISGNVITVESLATGVATIYPLFANLKLLQSLPTTAPAAVQTVLSISRDAAGNVQAAVSDVGGYAAGQALVVQLVPTASFNGAFELLGVKSNEDGVSGTLSWAQPPATGAASDLSGIGTVGSSPDILVNYQDELLIAEQDNEVTQQLSMSPPPAAADVYFVPSLQKYVYTRGLDSLFLFSQTTDAENIDLQNGSLSVDDNCMSLAICVREARTGEIIAIKEDSGYAVNPSDLSASRWPCPTRWKEHGPPCAAAVGKGTDFLIFPSFWSEAGCYLYKDGSLDWLTKEFQKVWDRVTRSAITSIWTLVDEQEKEIQIGVPLDGATTPSHIIVGSYIEGWGPQEVLNRYGKLITARSAIRWSIRLRATRAGAVVRRTLTAPQPSLSIDYPFGSVVRAQGIVTASYSNTIPPATILSIARTGGAVTAAVYLVALSFRVGDTVPVAGVTDNSFNGNFKVLSIVPIIGHGRVNGFDISWAQAGPDAVSAAGTIGLPLLSSVPPAVVPGGTIQIANVADPTFNGNFPTIAATGTTLSWLENVIGAPASAYSWAYDGAGTGSLVFRGTAPLGAAVGFRAYLRGTSSVLDGQAYTLATVVQSPGFYTVTFAAGGAAALSGFGGLAQFFAPPGDAASGAGDSYIVLQVPAPTADPRVQSRQVLLAPSGPDPFASVQIVSADRRTGVRGDLTVGGVLTLVFNGPLDGNVSEVIVSGMSDRSFDGEYDEPCTAAWGGDGVHSMLQFKADGPTGVAYDGILQSSASCLRVVMQDPTRLDDNGTALDSRYTPAFAQAGNMAVVRWGAFAVEVGGTGKVLLTPQTEDPAAVFDSEEINLDPVKPTRLQVGLRVQDNEYLTLSVSNGNKPGQGFVLLALQFYGVPIFSGRRV